MDLAKDLRTAQADLDAASGGLDAARTALDLTAAAYTVARRMPGSLSTVKARAAWGIALLEWANALIHREGLADLVAAERRRVDEDTADALLLPTRSHP